MQEEQKRTGEVTIQEALKEIKPTTKKILEDYSKIDLTEDEMDEAILWAKRKKVEAIHQQKMREIELENRKIQEMRWNYDMIRTFMWNRAQKIFKGKFTLDDYNQPLFDLLSFYFIEDEASFVYYANEIGVDNPSTKKGLLIPGVYGCGKTWMMQLFSRQKRQCFEIVRAKEISQQYLTSQDKKIPEIYFRGIKCNWDERLNNTDVNYPISEVFNQTLLGLCIDDLGSEEIQNSYGNKKNVIGDILEARYAAGYTGLFLHATTNLTAQELQNFYGGRVASRMREIFNFIKLPGKDRRK